MTQASFPQAARLKRPAEFTQALKGRRVARGALFTLIHQAHSQTAGPARLGLIVGKRFARRASTRNALKRVAREAFRHRRQYLANGDYVVRLHAPAPAMSLTSLKRQARSELDGLFDKAPILQGRRQDHA